MSSLLSRRSAVALAAALALVNVPASHAQGSYPDRPVKLVVAFAPGGIADQATRAIADKLAESLGQSVVVENRGGAGGNLATAAVARAAPDGYTVLLTTTSIVVNPALSASTGYDLAKDFVPVVQLASSANVIVANPAVGVRTLPEAIDKAKTAKYSFGSPGNGSTSHLTGAYLFGSLSKVDVVHVGYRGGALAIADTLGGQTQFAVVPVPVAAQHVKAGKLVALAVTSATRLKDWPEVQTVAESGFGGYTDSTWVGAFVPTGTPAAVVSLLNARINAVLALPEVASRLQSAGLEKQGGTPAQFASYVQTEATKWQRVVSETGIKGD